VADSISSATPTHLPQVDGSLGAWMYVVRYLYPEHDPPALTLSSVHTLLPVVHKYDFPKLLARLMAFVERNSEALSHDPAEPSYIVRWLALAERLHLDELLELCLGRLRSMSKEQRKKALTVMVEVGSDNASKQKRAVRKGVKQLGQTLRDELFVLIADAS
jgi:hypothetical protein